MWKISNFYIKFFARDACDQKIVTIDILFENIQGVRHWNVYFEMATVTILLDLQTCSEDSYIAEGRYFDIPALPLQKNLIKW